MVFLLFGKIIFPRNTFRRKRKKRAKPHVRFCSFFSPKSISWKITSQKLYLEKFEDCPGIGRIAVMDSNQLAMMGKVLDVEYATE